MTDKSRLSNIKQDRLKKLKELQESGKDPYPSKANRKHMIKQARDMMDQNVQVVGRIRSKRGHGKISFMDLEDETGKIQLLLRKDNLDDSSDLIKLLDAGDFIQAEGKVMKTDAGEKTIDVSSVTILSKSIRPLPDKWHGLSDVEERFRQRYVDLLINPDVRTIFEKRAQMIKLLRDYLDERGFLDVATPVLQPIYGGTTALPFTTHHNSLNTDLYLRIADELYLKRLIVGGFEKVYEIGVDFRNEGIDRWHNPEFTQIEFYWAYADYKDLMKMTEDMLSFVVKEITGSYEVTYGDDKLDFKPPWKQVRYRDVILEHTGIDIDTASLDDLKQKIQEKQIPVEISKNPDRYEIIDEIVKKAVRPNIKNPTFLIDYPSFMRPLAKKKEDDPDKVEAFQVVVAGTELINAYSELNDPIDQRTRWESEEKRGKEGVTEHQVVDEDYIRALEYGMPPTAGWGMGIERFLAILTNSHSIKEVILFPTLRPEFQTETSKPRKDTTSLSLSEIAHIDSDVKNNYPDMSFSVAVIKNVSVKKQSKELEKEKEKVLNTLGSLKTEEISTFSSIKAYRDLFKSFGVDWHSRRPSPDALLRRVAQGKGLYTVNTLVDAYNLAVLESKIGLGAFDMSQLHLPVSLRYAEEDEEIHLIGEEKQTQIKKGELIYADKKGPITLDVNYRDADRTKVTTDTKDIVLFADGAPGVSDDEVMSGLEKGIEYILRFCEGEVGEKILVK